MREHPAAERRVPLGELPVNVERPSARTPGQAATRRKNRKGASVIVSRGWPPSSHATAEDALDAQTLLGYTHRTTSRNLLRPAFAHQWWHIPLSKAIIVSC
eukprot:9484526-Pyramimonas_sp.AAC.1